MKKFVVSIFCFLLAAQAAFAQSAQATESQKLSQDIAAFYQQGKFDKAIPLAEKLVEIQRKSGNPQSLATALTNLAILRKERFQKAKRQLALTQPPPGTGIPREQFEERIKSVEEMNEDGEQAEKLFREVLDIYQNQLKTESPQLAMAQNEFGWLLYNYFKQPEKNIDATTQTNNSRARIDEAEKLLTQALTLREKILGAEDDATLATVLNLAEFYRRFVNYEKALPFYERFLLAAEKKYGKSNKNLIPALRSFAQVLVTTNREAQAAEIVKQIAGITGQKENLPQPTENLSLRITRSELERLQQIPSNKDVIRRYKRPIPVRVVIDENGKITEAIADVDDEKLKARIEQSIREISFRPFVYKGAPQKMRGVVSFSQLPFN